MVTIADRADGSEIEDAYPLTPLQNGMLFHRVQGENTGVYIEQMVATLRGPLDPRVFERAWSALAARHAILRTRFAWEGRDVAVQEVLRKIEAPFAWHDLAGAASQERDAEISRYLETDRARAFDLAVAPLWRCAVFRMGPEEHRLVWTYSHAILDDCVSALLRELFALIDEGERAQLPERRPYRDHVAWLGEHLASTRDAAQAFFREKLAGFDSPTGLEALARADASARGYGEKRFRLSRATSDALRALEGEGVRLSVLVEAAWGLVLAAFAGRDDVVFGVTRACRRTSLPGAEDTIGLFINTLPRRVQIDPEASIKDWLASLRAEQIATRPFEHTSLVDVLAVSDVARGTPLFETLLVFTDMHKDTRLKSLGGAWLNRDFDWHHQTSFPCSLLAYGDPEVHFKLSYDRRSFDERAMDRVAALTTTILEAFARMTSAGAKVGDLPRITDDEARRIAAWNDTRVRVEGDACVHRQLEAQVARGRDRVALVFRDATLTYGDLDARANALAARLRGLGVGPGVRVGVFVHRSIEMVVGLVAILKAGGAYVPMDPSYPSERIAMMLEDGGARAVITLEALRASLPPTGAPVVVIDGPGERADAPPRVDVRGDDLAYVIFTSGSTGRPKGVKLRHRNVTNFFAGMDTAIGTTPGVWLALTSISFDISVLEIFWTLCRGFTVVIQEEADRSERQAAAVDAKSLARPIEFSLFYFAADATAGGRAGAYRLLLEGAKFADEHDFAAVWTPERHFHAFGGLYPNPAVTSAAVAVLTKRIALRAGSVVLPLHNPIRCAEEWSVVDNLSGGRVGLSFASGWHANDFALAPQNFQDRRRLMAEGIETVRALWRGEAVPATSGDGRTIQVRMFPPPIQREPRIWITAGGSPETFAMAGKMGASILTNLLVMKREDLEKNIATYRAAWREAGHAGEGHITLMLHAFVGDDLDAVRTIVREPFLEYLRTSTDLINKARWELTSFAKPNVQRAPSEGARDLDGLSAEEKDAIMAHAFDRYFATAGLFGTPASCKAQIESLKALGVDEIACLIDFGVDPDVVLQHLPHLDELRRRSNAASQASEPGAEDFGIAAQIVRHRVTHLQCTPSLAGILASDPTTFDALASVSTLLLGGEALPSVLRDRVRATARGRILNMYGPTETTIWSTCADAGAIGAAVTIGRPIANTRVHVVDRHLRDLPIGVPGELVIGGDGVAEGYLDRDDLTRERFVERSGDRLYRTGDLARFRDDGAIDFLGRLDHQVKIRGYRIELGEIEATLARHPAVREAVVIARPDDGSGEPRLVAYVVPRDAADGESAAQWRAIWDDTYAHGEPTEPALDALDTVGWTSSYTGDPIAQDEMRTWVDETTSRILGLGPRRVLEIGSGTGMLALRIAPRVDRYFGIDFAPAAIQRLGAKLAAAGIANVELRAMAARDVGTIEERFDAVVLNSVAQYLASVDELVEVIERAFTRLAPGGAMFVGDVRSLPHLAAFHASIELHRAPDALGMDELRARIERRAAQERELVIDPTFFPALKRVLPDLAEARVLLKSQGGDNEMTRFRYDVVLRKAGPDIAAPAEARGVDAPAPVTVEALQAMVRGEAAALRVVGLLNARVAEAVRAAESIAANDGGATVGELRARLRAASPGAIDPREVASLDDGYDVACTWSARADRFDLIARHRTHGPRVVAVLPPHDGELRPWAAYANAPQRAAARDTLGPALRAHVRVKLPDYMVPSAFVVLDALPLTANGKIDRKALPAPDRARAETTAAYRPPTNDTEQVIATVWQDMLSIDRVGVDQNFFDLGANSLMVVQASGRLRAALGRNVSIVDLFRFTTVRALAAQLSGATSSETSAEDDAARATARKDAVERRRQLRQATRTRE